ncbi:calcium:proton antiporter [Chitinasiproducens palmae]|nr:calcium:proton antiporter [Chitinasiproducens palmae]
MTALRLAIGWLAVLAVKTLGPAFGLTPSPLVSALCLALLLAVIVWTAFGVVHEAEALAELLGDLLGTLVLTLSVVIIEVALVAAVMLGAEGAPTLGRDTMFAVQMIVLNGVVGLKLLIGGFRYREQTYNLQGATAYLTVLIPLTVFPLVLPNFTRSTADGTMTVTQAAAFSLMTIVLYGVFLILQTGRHRDHFQQPAGGQGQDLPPSAAAAAIEADHPSHDAAATPRRPHLPLDSGSDSGNGNGGGGGGGRRSRIVVHCVRLLASILVIVLLAKGMAQLLDQVIVALDAPAALGGVLIAAIVFTPEAITALRAANNNELQRAINLCLGAATSTVGLTVPAVLGIGLLTGQPAILGLPPTEMVLLAVTLLMSALTFSGSRTTMLGGATHLVVFFAYLVLIFSP